MPYGYGKSTEFENIISDFQTRFGENPNGFGDFKKYMEAQYKDFSTRNGSEFAKRLNVNVCPYCNRQYIFTITKTENKKGVRPEFDHFHPKSKYPYLALSLYNLVPCCHTCNHAKGDDNQMNLLNPYNEGFPKESMFKIDKLEECILKGDKERWNIALPEKGKHRSHIDSFVLDDLYNQHKDYVEEIVFKAQAYNDDYYNGLAKNFSELGLTEKEMKLMIFGNYITSEDYVKRPLSKLTANILEQLDIKL